MAEHLPGSTETATGTPASTSAYDGSASTAALMGRAGEQLGLAAPALGRRR